MTAQQTLIEQYLAIWNEQDETGRAKLAEQVFTEDAGYVDPMAVAEGRSGIVATVGAVQQQFPGWTFRLLGTVDAHHNLARFGWTLSPEGTDDPAAAPIVGFDVAVITGDGQISNVHGFLDRVPAG